MIAFLLQAFIAIASIEKLAGYAAQFAAGVMGWYMNGAKEDQKVALSDAVSLSLSAETDEEFSAASKAWQKAMSMPRILK